MTDAGTPAAPPASRERLGWLGVAMFFAALIVRGLHLLQIHSAVFFPLLLGDAEGYALWAAELAGGDWLGDQVFYQAPLYPYFMGVVYSLAGESPTAVKIVQALLGSGACVLLAGAGLRFFSKPVGVLAGFVLAIYPPAIFFDALIQKSALDGFLMCALLYELGGLQTRATAARWLAVGATLGALILTRENALVLLPPILAFALWKSGRDFARGAARVALLSTGVALLLLPVALRNWSVGGEFHLTTSQFGTNFYIGNNPMATGGYVPLRYGRGSWEHEREDATALAEAAAGRSLSPAEVSSFWTGRALEFVSGEPAAWLQLLGRKLALLSNAAEFVDTEDLYTHAESSFVLRASIPWLHFGVIAPLALLGVLIAGVRRRDVWLLVAMTGCYAASVALFYVFARYRQPLVPLLILFAAAGVIGLPAFIRTHSMRARIGSLLCVTTVAIFCNWPLESRAVMRSATHHNIAVLLERRGEPAAARAELLRALEFDPTSVLALHALATSHLDAGELDEAERRYREALTRKPEHAPSHAKLGIVLARRSAHEAAIQHYERALSIEPEHALAHFQLGLSLTILGRDAEAAEHFREALRIEPGNRRRLARTVLGTLSAPQLGAREAAAALRLAVLAAEAEPADASAVEALAAAYAANGRLDLAAQSAVRAEQLAATDADLSPADRERIASRAARYSAAVSR